MKKINCETVQNADAHLNRVRNWPRLVLGGVFERAL